MKILNNTKRTRLKLTVLGFLVSSILTAYAMYVGMSDVATIGLGGLTSTWLSYNWGETKRPSNAEK